MKKENDFLQGLLLGLFIGAIVSWFIFGMKRQPIQSTVKRSDDFVNQKIMLIFAPLKLNK